MPMSLRLSIAIAFLCSVPTLAQQNRPSKHGCFAKFTSKVSSDESFVRGLGNGLSFRLDPSGKGLGWTMEIHATNSNKQDQYIYVVTPPYRHFSPRDLNVSYGYSAREVVAMTPRRFKFVLTPENYEKALASVRLLLWNSGQTENQVEEARRFLDEVPKGTGTFRILDSRISGTEDGQPGRIDWLKFEVELCKPAVVPKLVSNFEFGILIRSDIFNPSF